MISLPLPPLSTNHSYHTNNGRWYKDSKSTAWETECLWILKKHTAFMRIEYDVHLWFYFANKRRNDIDGRIKPVLDILQKAGLYKDDSLIVNLFVHKRYDKTDPRVDITIT